MSMGRDELELKMQTLEKKSNRLERELNKITAAMAIAMGVGVLEGIYKGPQVHIATTKGDNNEEDD